MMKKLGNLTRYFVSPFLTKKARIFFFNWEREKQIILNTVLQ